MTKATVDAAQARAVLREAIDRVKARGFTPSHPKTQKIADVMLGKHLTYRYVLITNLLAKATSPEVNGLSLQAKAELEGAFDSRSLCHDVIVGADRDPNALAGKLGRSNEPYLNKPARYPALTTNNAVRRGYDRSILEKSIDILGGLTDRADASVALKDAIYYTLKREALVAEAAELEGDATLHMVLSQFGAKLVANSHEGETCALLAGLSFFILGRAFGRAFEIKVHPVNQAGSSSREVLDIDVYFAKELHHSAEVKDKKFTIHDVDHAASKVRAAGLESFFFICGPQSGGINQARGFVETIADKGVKVSFVDIDQFYSTALGFSPSDLGAEEVWEFIDTSMTSARVKDDTRKHVIESARATGLVSGEG